MGNSSDCEAVKILLKDRKKEENLTEKSLSSLCV